MPLRCNGGLRMTEHDAMNKIGQPSCTECSRLQNTVGMCSVCTQIAIDKLASTGKFEKSVCFGQSIPTQFPLIQLQSHCLTCGAPFQLGGCTIFTCKLRGLAVEAEAVKGVATFFEEPSAHEFLYTFAEKVFAKCVATMRKKNSDYTGMQGDPFSNFKDEKMSAALEPLGLDAIECGIRTRLKDKWERVSNLLLFHPAQVTSEAMDDTMEDAINYFAIWLAYREWRRTHDGT